MNARNRDSCRQLFRNVKILPLKSQYSSPLLLFVAKYRDQIQKFIILTVDSVLTYMLQLQTSQFSRKIPFILESKILITLRASKIHLMT